MDSSNQPYNLGGNINFQNTDDKVYGRKRFKWGCFGILGLIPVLIIIILIAYFFAYPALTPNKIRGDFMNMAYTEGKSGKNVLWIMTDGSFSYIQSTKSPGSYSVGRKCMFCKTWTYMIDPETQKVLNKFKTPFEDIITQSFMTSAGDKVWVVTGAYGDNEARVFEYNGETGEQILDTKGFINKFPELSSGLTSVRMEKNPDRIVADTKDGQTGVIITLDDEKFYQSYSEFNGRLENKSTETITKFALGAAGGSGPRMKLYKVTGPYDKIGKDNISASYLDDPKTLDFFMKSTAEQLTPNKVYIEGIIYYQDDEGCLILHQDNAGKKADRMITLVGADGKEKWTIQQDELFKKLKIDEDKDPFSKIFFMKDDIEIERHGKLVTVMVKGEGMQAYDYKSGKKVFEMDI